MLSWLLNAIFSSLSIYIYKLSLNLYLSYISPDLTHPCTSVCESWQILTVPSPRQRCDADASGLGWRVLQWGSAAASPRIFLSTGHPQFTNQDPLQAAIIYTLTKPPTTWKPQGDRKSKVVDLFLSYWLFRSVHFFSFFLIALKTTWTAYFRVG